MVSKGAFMVLCHLGVTAVAALLLLWAGGASAASPRHPAATPHTPYRYIPLHGSFNDYNEDLSPVEDDSPSYTYSGMPPSQLILTGLRTILDVVRNINKKRANRNRTTHLISSKNSTAVPLRRIKSRSGANETAVESGRGFEDYYDEHHDHDEPMTTAKPAKQSRYTDPWAGYYDWIINEGSFKFWSIFQLFTAALLLYACLSAIYYAKFNPILPDYSMEYDDYFLQRTIGRNARSSGDDWPSGLSWMNSQTFQFILDAISKHYAEK